MKNETLSGRERTLEWVLFCFVFVSHGYFHSDRGANQNARLAAIFSFVEPNSSDYSSLRINRFVEDSAGDFFTIDWASHDGDYYSNKAPGSSLLGIPLYYLLFHIETSLGLDVYSKPWKAFNVYLLNLWVSVFWTALACMFFFRFLIDRSGYGVRDAVSLTIIYAFGTLVFPFDTSVWGHTTAASLLMLSFYLLFGEMRGIWVSGLFLGLAVLVEYASVVALPGSIAFLVLWRRKNLFSFLLGLLPGISILLLYQKLCFGSALVMAPMLSNPIHLNTTKIFGIFGNISPMVFLKLLFSLNRGLFVYSPVLLFVAFGLRNLLSPRRRDILLVALTTILLNLLLISSITHAWHGGWSSGPRYLIISLPFWCLLLPRLSDAPRPFRIIFGGIALVSIMNMLVVASVDVQAKSALSNPLYGQFYGRFVRGDLQQNIVSRLGGIKGIASLIPLFGFMLFGLSHLFKKTKHAFFGTLVSTR